MVLSACDICEAKAALNCNYDPVTEAAMKVTGVYLGDVLKSNLVKNLASEIFFQSASCVVKAAWRVGVTGMGCHARCQKPVAQLDGQGCQ
jgi:hypothetical protein